MISAEEIAGGCGVWGIGNELDDPVGLNIGAGVTQLLNCDVLGDDFVQDFGSDGDEFALTEIDESSVEAEDVGVFGQAIGQQVDACAWVAESEGGVWRAADYVWSVRRTARHSPSD